ncbi:SDR family oxidoreductase [Naasia sp. SYSU D00948]|uniref:SDR family oxidoreductase n=1 Tax=Naasia sp. SYSU D00948 TaxID=2817379 RepID=UPI001B312506|nr:SDR family oxidoreductase [Naasia sp. SYSU D00948]
MRVAIAGGHGKIALLLSRLLADNGHDVVGIVRNPAHVADIEAAGAAAAVLDLEQAGVAELAEVLQDADAVVFAAGGGPGSGAARKLTMDRDGAVLLADAAEQAGIRRYVLVSAMSADDYDPEKAELAADESDGDGVFQVYLRAKSEADAAVRERDLDWTIVRPGGLTNDPGTGSVSIAPKLDRGSIPRADVAAVIAELLTTGAGVRSQFELVSGPTPIAEAVAALR